MGTNKAIEDGIIVIELKLAASLYSLYSYNYKEPSFIALENNVPNILKVKKATWFSYKQAIVTWYELGHCKMLITSS